METKEQERLFFLLLNNLPVWCQIRIALNLCDVPLNAVYKTGTFDKNNVTEYIVEGLGKDIPVAMFIALNDQLNNIEVTFPDGLSWIQESITRHWVTVS